MITSPVELTGVHCTQLWGYILLKVLVCRALPQMKTCLYEKVRYFLYLPFLPSLPRGRSTCGCNSSQNRSLGLFKLPFRSWWGVYCSLRCINKGQLLWETHMNEFAWAINQWSCWFRGFYTVPSENRSTVFSSTPSGSGHNLAEGNFQMQRQIIRAFFYPFRWFLLHLYSNLSHLQPVPVVPLRV